MTNDHMGECRSAPPWAKMPKNKKQAGLDFMNQRVH